MQTGSVRPNGAGPPRPDETATGLADLVGIARRHLRLLVLTAVATVVVALGAVSLQTPQFRATVDILVDPQVLQVVGRGLTRSDTSPSIDLANVDSQASVFLSVTLLRQVIEELRLADDPAFGKAAAAAAQSGTDAPLLDALRERLIVRRVDNSLVFQVTVSHPAAAQAARIANAIAAAYLRQAALQRSLAVKRAGGSLLDQTADLRAKLNKAEIAVERFRAENGLVSTGKDGLIVNQQLTQLAAQISNAAADLARISTRQDRLNRQTPEQILADSSPEVMVSPTIASLKTQLARLTEEEAQLSQTLGPSHPQLATVRTQRQAVRKLMVTEIERTRRAMEEEVRRARETLAALKRREQELTGSQSASNEAEIRLRQLESEAEAIRTVYNASVARVKELEQQQGLDTNNSRIVSDAVAPTRPSGAPKALVGAAGLLFGTVLGLALAFGRELMTGTLASVAAVRRATGLPVLATLGTGGASGAAEDRAALLRAARTLRRQLGPRLPALVIVTGPGEAGERKRVAAALAGVLEELGEPVLRCSQAAGQANLTAVSSVPTPRPSAAMPTTRPAPAAKPSLPVPAGPEFIIVDVDPDAPDDLVGAFDAADAVLIGVRPGYVTRAALRRLVGALDEPGEGSSQVVLGLVCLGAPPRRATSRRRSGWLTEARLAASRLSAARA